VWFPLGHLGILGFRLLPFGNPVRVPITQKPQECAGGGLDTLWEHRISACLRLLAYTAMSVFTGDMRPSAPGRVYVRQHCIDVLPVPLAGVEPALLSSWSCRLDQRMLMNLDP
jgi:hypothetical protein